MLRRVFLLLNLLLLLACVGTCALWARSYWRGDEITVLRRNAEDRRITQYKFYNGSGLIFLCRSVYVFNTPGQVARFGPPSGVLRGSNDPSLVDMGSALAPRMGSDPTGVAYAIIPHWYLALPLLIAVAWRTRRFLQKLRRRSPSECAVCGYDLRATPDRCPECGTLPAAPKVNA